MDNHKKDFRNARNKGGEIRSSLSGWVLNLSTVTVLTKMTLWQHVLKMSDIDS